MEKRTGVITFKGAPLTLLGPAAAVGTKAPDFTALSPELQPVSLHDSQGKVRIISVVPSIDTPVCDLQTARFNQEAGQLPELLVLSISVDLPFALARYCAAKGIDNVKTLSDHRALDFGLKYGFVIEELRLLSRGILVIDQQDTIRHIEYVAEVTEQPDYDKALAVAKTLL